MANRHNRRRLNRIEQGKKRKGRSELALGRPYEAPKSSPVKGQTDGLSTDSIGPDRKAVDWIPRWAAIGRYLFVAFSFYEEHAEQFRDFWLRE